MPIQSGQSNREAANASAFSSPLVSNTFSASHAVKHFFKAARAAAISSTRLSKLVLLCSFFNSKCAEMRERFRDELARDLQEIGRGCARVRGGQGAREREGRMPGRVGLEQRLSCAHLGLNCNRVGSDRRWGGSYFVESPFRSVPDVP